MNKSEAAYFSYLFDLIKFDLQQIQNYRIEIIGISITLIGASFALTALLQHREIDLDLRTKRLLLVLSDCCLLGILIVTAAFYLDGIDGSRAALELREIALKEVVDTGREIRAKDLYPDTSRYQVSMKSWLEKFPIFLAMLLILVKIIIEWIGLRATYAQQSPPAVETPVRQP